MTANEIEKIKLFIEMKKENVPSKSIKNILKLSDDEYRQFSQLLFLCNRSKVNSTNMIQPSLFEKSRRSVAEFLINNPFKYKTTTEIAEAINVSKSTVQRSFNDYPEIKKLLFYEETKDLFLENVSFHKKTTQKAINLIEDNYFNQNRKTNKEELIEAVGFSKKACQSFLKRFPNYSVLVNED